MTLRRVSPDEAQALMREEGYAYLDVRTVAEFDEGHPQGAYNVPWQQPGAHGLELNPHFLRDVGRTFAPDAKLVVGCASGVRSLAAAEALRENGYQNVVEQRAGFSGVRDPFGGVQARGWRELGLPSATRAERGRSYRDLQEEA